MSKYDLVLKTKNNVKQSYIRNVVWVLTVVRKYISHLGLQYYNTTNYFK